MHPTRAVRRAVTRKSVKRERRAMNPVSYAVERSVNTKPRSSGSGAPVYRHCNCSVKHRSANAASRCRRDW